MKYTLVGLDKLADSKTSYILFENVKWYCFPLHVFITDKKIIEKKYEDLYKEITSKKVYVYLHELFLLKPEKFLKNLNHPLMLYLEGFTKFYFYIIGKINVSMTNRVIYTIEIYKRKEIHIEIETEIAYNYKDLRIDKLREFYKQGPCKISYYLINEDGISIYFGSHTIKCGKEIFRFLSKFDTLDNMMKEWLKNNRDELEKYKMYYDEFNWKCKELLKI